MFAPIEHFCTTKRVENAASKSGLQSLDEGIPPKIYSHPIPSNLQMFGKSSFLIWKRSLYPCTRGFSYGTSLGYAGRWMANTAPSSLPLLLLPNLPPVFDTKSCCSCSPARKLWTHGPPSSAFKSCEHRCPPSCLAFVSKGPGKTHRAGEDNMRIVSDMGGIKLLAMEF